MPQAGGQRDLLTRPGGRIARRGALRHGGRRIGRSPPASGLGARFALPSDADIVRGVTAPDAPPTSLFRRTLTSIVLIVGVIAVGAFAFVRLASLRAESARTDVQPPAPLVRAQVAKRQAYQEVLRGFGKAGALRRATVTAEVAGVIEEVSPLLEAGASICAGRAADGATGAPGSGADATLPVLLRLDDRDFEDRLQRAQSELEVALAEKKRLQTNRVSLQARVKVAAEELETATAELRRIAPLVPKTLTKSDLDAQRMQVNARQGQLLVIEALVAENAESLLVADATIAVRNRQIALAQREKERTVIRPPYAGRIEARHVNVGERVRIGDPLFTIVDLSKVEVPVALPARRFLDVRPGAKAAARLPDGDEILWEGTVNRVAPGVQSEDRTFYAYVVIEGVPDENPAPPGAHLLIEVDGRRHEGVIPVPRQAFLGDRLFVATPDGDTGESIVTVRTPTVSRLLPGQALVTDGLEDGEAFLITNIESVAEGSRVRIAPTKADDDP